MTVSTTLPDDFETGDVRAAAFMMAKGFKLLRMSGTERRRFHFEPTARAAATEYYAEAEAPAKKLFHALADLRTLMKRGIVPTRNEE